MKILPFNSENQHEGAVALCRGYAALSDELLTFIGRAGRQTIEAKTENERESCGQLTRRLCYALIGY